MQDSQHVQIEDETQPLLPSRQPVAKQEQLQGGSSIKPDEVKENELLVGPNSLFSILYRLIGKFQHYCNPNFWRHLYIFILTFIIWGCTTLVFHSLYTAYVTFQCFTDLLHWILTFRNIFDTLTFLPVYKIFGITCCQSEYSDTKAMCPCSYGDIRDLIATIKYTPEQEENESETKKSLRTSIVEYYKRFICGWKFLLIAGFSIFAILVFFQLSEGNSSSLLIWVLLCIDVLRAVNKIFHQQFFWIICFTVHENIRQMDPIVNEMKRIVDKNPDIVDSDTQIRANENLRRMIKKCSSINRLITAIDSKISWLIFCHIQESICFIVAALLLYNHSYKVGTTPVMHACYSLILAFRFYFFTQSFNVAFRIPSYYNDYVSQYKSDVMNFLTKSFQGKREEFLEFRLNFIASKNYFDKAPAFTVGGIFKMQKLSYLIIACIKVFLTYEIGPGLNQASSSNEITSFQDIYLPQCPTGTSQSN